MYVLSRRHGGIVFFLTAFFFSCSVCLARWLHKLPPYMHITGFQGGPWLWVDIVHVVACPLVCCGSASTVLPLCFGEQSLLTPPTVVEGVIVFACLCVCVCVCLCVNKISQKLIDGFRPNCAQRLPHIVTHIVTIKHK